MKRDDDADPSTNYDPRLSTLMRSPAADPDRAKLRDQVRTRDNRLAAKARKFLTLGAIYAQRETFAKQQAEGLKWERWLSSFMSPADVKAMVNLQRARQAADNARNDEERT